MLSDAMKMHLLDGAGRLADSDLFVRGAIAACKSTRLLLGKNTAYTLANIPGALIGTVFQHTGVVFNIHSFGLTQRIRSGLSPLRPVRKRQPTIDPGTSRRVGVVGPMSSGRAIPFDFVEKFPEPHSLLVFDVDTKTGCKPLPARPNFTMQRHALLPPMELQNRDGILVENEEYLRQIASIAESINDARLDCIVLAMASHAQRSDLATLLDTPCIISYLHGSEPLFHNKVDYCLHAQPKRGFYIQDRTMYSEFTHRPLPAEPCVVTDSILLDSDLIDSRENPPWDCRKPMLLYHGRLPKLNSPPFLTALAGMLRDYSELTFSILGYGDGLEQILAFFKENALAERVQYCGHIDKATCYTGTFHDPIYSFLRQGRCEPNPWPYGGGATRLEAYKTGTASVHMRLRFGDTYPWDSNTSLVDIPAFGVPTLTADTPAEYRELCLRCIFDKDFYEATTREQYSQIRKAVNTRQWWNEFFNAHEQWLSIRKQRQ